MVIFNIPGLDLSQLCSPALEGSKNQGNSTPPQKTFLFSVVSPVMSCSSSLGSAAERGLDELSTPTPSSQCHLYPLKSLTLRFNNPKHLDSTTRTGASSSPLCCEQWRYTEDHGSEGCVSPPEISPFQVFRSVSTQPSWEEWEKF